MNKLIEFHNFLFKQLQHIGHNTKTDTNRFVELTEHHFEHHTKNEAKKILNGSITGMLDLLTRIGKSNDGYFEDSFERALMFTQQIRFMLGFLANKYNITLIDACLDPYELNKEEHRDELDDYELEDGILIGKINYIYLGQELRETVLKDIRFIRFIRNKIR